MRKFARVRWHSHEGWVAAEFLSRHVLTAEAAMEHADSDRAARLAWLQRAEVLRPDRAVLVALEAEYRARGNTEDAALVAARLKWPDGLFLVARYGDETWITVRSEEAPEPAQDSPIDDDVFRKQFGLDPRATGWVLPDEGPAVKGRLVGAQLAEIGGCGGHWETVVDVAAELPADREPIAFFRGDEPPAGWRVAAPTNPVPESRARQVVDEHLARSTEIGMSKTELQPMPIGWLVSIREKHPSLPVNVWQSTSFLVTPGETREVRTPPWQGDERLHVARDLTGDGEVEFVLYGGDEQVVRTLEGRRMTGMVVLVSCE